MAKFDLNAYMQDPAKRKNVIIVGGLGLVVVLALIIFMVTRPSGEEAPADAGGGFAPAAGGSPFPGPGGPGGPNPGGPPTPVSTPGGPTGGPSVGAPPTTTVSTPAQSGGGAGTLAGGKNAKPVKDTKPLYQAREDPFQQLNAGASTAEYKRLVAKARAQWEAANLQYQMAQLPAMTIYKPAVKINPNAPNPNAPVEVPVQRRVAGLMYGDRVAAVLESNGSTDVVRPGDIIESGGQRVRVTRIDRDAVVLRRLDNKKSIRVPLASAPEGGAVGGPNVGGPPMPGGPFPGGPRPGGPVPLVPEG